MKFKDFTLASKNVGRGVRAPPPVPIQLPPMVMEVHQVLSLQVLTVIFLLYTNTFTVLSPI